MEGIYPVLWLLVALIALVPVCIFWVSYSRVKSRKLLITALAFTLFFVKAAGFASELLFNALGGSDYPEEITLSFAAILDIIIISLFALPLLEKDENGNGYTNGHGVVGEASTPEMKSGEDELTNGTENGTKELTEPEEELEDETPSDDLNGTDAVNAKDLGNIEQDTEQPETSHD